MQLVRERRRIQRGDSDPTGITANITSAALTVTGMPGRFMLVMASARHVGGVWHRVMVIVRFR
jgi:hypothetical protein